MRTKDKKVYVYVDGFNLYHSLDGYLKRASQLDDSYKWIDQKVLVTNYLDKSEYIESIKFFSAIPKYSSDKAKIKRHKKYVKVLKEYVSSVSCTECQTPVSTKKHEEKETDVSIGIEAVHDILTQKKNIHKIIIVSNDTDFMPIIRYILENTTIRIVILIPLGCTNAGQFSDIAKQEQRIEITQVSQEAMDRSRMNSSITIEKQTIISPYAPYNSLHTKPQT